MLVKMCFICNNKYTDLKFILLNIIKKKTQLFSYWKELTFDVIKLV